MDGTEFSQAVLEWATATCPDLNSVYDLDAEQVQHALPVAFASVVAEEDAPAKPSLGIAGVDLGLEQTTVHAGSVSIEFMVDDDDEADDRLKGFVNQLAEAIRAEHQGGAGDVTLDGRVDGASPYWTSSYEPPFAVWEDGTKARRAEFTLAVAELL
jgi:hypothetical protein